MGVPAAVHAAGGVPDQCVRAGQPLRCVILVHCGRPVRVGGCDYRQARYLPEPVLQRNCGGQYQPPGGAGDLSGRRKLGSRQDLLQECNLI